MKIFWLFLSGIFLLAGCGEDSDPTRSNDFIPLTGITIESENPQIAVGTSNRFTALGDFSGVFSRDVTDQAQFSSSDAGILVFDDPGAPEIARGIAAGTATVSASVGEITNSIGFTVTGETIVTLTLTPDTISLPLGSSQQFTASGTFSGGTVQDVTRDVTFTSSSPELVAIETAGLATAVQVGGPVTITATFDGVIGNAQITVTEPVAESLVIAPAEPVLIPGETLQLTATAAFTDGTEDEVTIQATWESSDPDVAIVDGVGRVTAENDGEATITATFGGQTATAALTVAAPDLLDVTPQSQIISVGGALQMTAEVTLSNDTTRDVTSMATWTSSNPAVATVDSAGLVQGITNGSAAISASLGGQTDSATISVQ